MVFGERHPCHVLLTYMATKMHAYSLIVEQGRADITWRRGGGRILCRPILHGLHHQCPMIEVAGSASSPSEIKSARLLRRWGRPLSYSDWSGKVP
jgi:hypothetical protein